MIIHCPKCHFEREIDSGAIPPNAAMATCPKCLHRFSFRASNKEAIGDMSSVKSTRNTTESEGGVQSEKMQEFHSAENTPPVDVGADEAEKPMPGISLDAGMNDGDLLPFGAESNPVKSREDRTGDGKNSIADNHQSQRFEKKGIPWEERRTYGFWGGLYQTVLRVMFQPARFFSAVPDCRGSKKPAILFYLIFEMLQTVTKLFWIQEALETLIADPKFSTVLGNSHVDFTGGLLLAPILLYFQLYFYTALFFLMVKLVDPDKAAFAPLLRVVAYSSAVLVVSVVPVAGAMVAFIWFAVCCFIGCRYALGLSWINTSLALLPLYVIALVINIQTLLQLSAVM